MSDKWTLVAEERGVEREFDSLPDAQEAEEDLGDLVETEIVPPDTTHENDKIHRDAQADGGTETIEPDVVEHPPDDSEDDSPAMEQAAPMPSDGAELPVDSTADSGGGDVEDTSDESAGYSLPERSVSDDPMKWVPGEFVDKIDGSQAINRKGFAVLAHFYKIQTSSEVITAPEDTDFEFCRVKAVATTKDGREYEAHGSAHTDRGDDSFLLLEMADTRAKKRALADATGVGAVAVSELKSELGA